MNLPELLQQHFNYAPLEKMDPNAEDVSGQKKEFGQAAIPAVLTGLYTFSRSDEGATLLAKGGSGTDWLHEIFQDREQDLVKRVAAYADEPEPDVERKLQLIAVKAAELVREEAAPDYAILKIKDILGDQRVHLLPYLPAVLQIGDLLHDSTLDDKTNKMEGPVSQLIKRIGAEFSKADEGSKSSHF